MSCALFTCYPELGAGPSALRHLALGEFPTALEQVRGLLPDDVELWVKREDRSGARYGGNKVRKLEFLLADARVRERRRVLTFGGYGSHHVLATAIYARELGLLCDGVIYPQPPSDHVRDTMQQASAAGARLWPSRGYLDVPCKLARALRAPGGRALIVAPGGSSPLGTLGWVSGGLEIAAQVRAGVAPSFDAVYVALGSGGTAAGLWLGLGDAAAEVVAVRVVPRLVGNLWLVRNLARGTARLIAPHLSPGHHLPPRPALRVDGRWLGRGYGHDTEAAFEAVRRAEQAGLMLEMTYTGKTVAALLADAASGRLRGKRVLLVNTYSSVDLSSLDE